MIYHYPFSSHRILAHYVSTILRTTSCLHFHSNYPFSNVSPMEALIVGSQTLNATCSWDTGHFHSVWTIARFQSSIHILVYYIVLQWHFPYGNWYKPGPFACFHQSIIPGLDDIPNHRHLAQTQKHHPSACMRTDRSQQVTHYKMPIQKPWFCTWVTVL